MLCILCERGLFGGHPQRRRIGIRPELSEWIAIETYGNSSAQFGTNSSWSLLWIPLLREIAGILFVRGCVESARLKTTTSFVKFLFYLHLNLKCSLEINDKKKIIHLPMVAVYLFVRRNCVRISYATQCWDCASKKNGGCICKPKPRMSKTRIARVSKHI